MDRVNTLLLLGGVLLLFGVLASTLSARLGLPFLLIFLVIGMLAGEDGPSGIRFDDFGASFFFGNLALAIVLLDGGLRTRISTFRVGLWPATAFTTWGSLTDLRGRAVRCAALVRHSRPLLAPSATALKANDVVWQLASPEQVEHLTSLFSPQELSGRLAVCNFFGVFVLNADSSAAALVATYGIALDETASTYSIGELLAKRLGRRPVVGDRVGIGGMELTVRAVEGNRVASVGLKISKRR